MVTRHKEYLRSILFGIEDSLISTTGFIAGISVSSSNARVVILSTLVAICIEGVSMGVGEYLSDDTIEELDKVKRHRENPLLSGVLLCLAYLLAGMIPFVPILLFHFPVSLLISLIAALLSLFFLGYMKGKLLKRYPIQSGMKILAVGGITTVFGILLGLLFKI